MIFACFSTLALVLWWNPTHNSHGPARCTVFQQLCTQQALSEHRSYTITTKSSCNVQNCIHDGRCGRERTLNVMLFNEWRRLYINGNRYVLCKLYKCFCQKLHNYEKYIIIMQTMVTTVVIARELHANE